jgi:hypothetical protein
MKIDEVAEQLDVSVRVAYRMLQKDGRAMGAIRVGENGGSWRVVRVMFERWLAGNNEGQAWRESSDDEGPTESGSRSTTAGSQTPRRAARVGGRRSARTPSPLSAEPTSSNSKPLIPIVRRRRKRPSMTP